MGIKSEKKKLNNLIGETSSVPEFIENLRDQLNSYKLPEASKKAIRGVLAKKFREFDILDTEPVKLLYKNLGVFTKNIFNEKYQDCVLEIQNNLRQMNLANEFASIRNLNKKKRKK